MSSCVKFHPIASSCVKLCQVVSNGILLRQDVSSSFKIVKFRQGLSSFVKLCKFCQVVSRGGFDIMDDQGYIKESTFQFTDIYLPGKQSNLFFKDLLYFWY